MQPKNPSTLKKGILDSNKKRKRKRKWEIEQQQNLVNVIFVIGISMINVCMLKYVRFNQNALLLPI